MYKILSEVNKQILLVVLSLWLILTCLIFPDIPYKFGWSIAEFFDKKLQLEK